MRKLAKIFLIERYLGWLVPTSLGFGTDVVSTNVIQLSKYAQGNSLTLWCRQTSRQKIYTDAKDFSACSVLLTMI